MKAIHLHFRKNGTGLLLLVWSLLMVGQRCGQLCRGWYRWFFQLKTPLSYRFWGALLALLVGVALSNARAQISGTVFQDFNANGTQGTTTPNTEPGYDGITVKAYNAAGAVVASTTTTAGGSYTLAGVTGPVRVEFTGLPSSYYSGPLGAQSKTSVQFVTGPATNVNFGINYPANYCQPNPNLATPCYLNGAASGTGDVLVSWPYSNSGITGTVNHVATQSQIGSTYGLAYDRTGKRLFSSSWLKRHVGLPDLNGDGKGDLGNIFVTNTITNTTSLWLDLTTLGINFGTVGNDASRGLTGLTNPSTDATVFTMIGKAGIGDIDISDDGTTLYLTNLYDKKLYAIDVATKTIKGSWTIPQNCSNNEVNMGLKYYQGALYVGQVCTVSPLSATVYRFDNNNFTSVLNFPLTYKKGYNSDGCPSLTYWLSWTNTFPSVCINNYVIYPQAILSDIEFEPFTGRMIIGIRDRSGDQIGWYNYNTSGSGSFLTMSFGDLLGATANSDGTFTLENNGKVDGITSGGTGNGQGPGGGEFYYEDNYIRLTEHHREVLTGSLALLPGTNAIVSTSVDPVQGTSGGGGNVGGVRFMNNMTGRLSKAFQLYDANDPGIFGKANGLGDLELLCDPAPIEIGNRVWKDTNGNGIQDPGEPALAGVSVQLTDAASGTVIAVAITDANGNYIFSSATSTSTASSKYGLNLLPTTNYTLKITALGSDTSVSGLTLTGITLAPGEISATNSGSSLNNNDAFLAGGLPTINLTTGPTGANNHTYDFGLTTVLPASLGDYVWFDTNKNGQQDAGEMGVASVTVVLYDAVSGTVVSTTLTDATGKYLFTNLNAGSYYVKFTAPTGTTFTTANVGNDATDSDVASLTGNMGSTGTYSLTAGQQDLTVDAGLIPLPASLGDYVWLDTNKNGQQDPGETGVASVTAVLYDAVSGTVVSTTLTDATGKYLFTNLNAGSYYVKFTAPTGTTFTTANVGNDATDSDVASLTGNMGSTGTYSLTAGQQDLTVDAGLIPLLACLGDYVWLDANQNGQQDPGETGVASVTAVLYDATTNAVVSTTVTDATGKYLFCNLNPGSYYVVFTAPAGTTFTTANVGNDATDSDAGTNGQTGVYSLTAGQTDLTVDAGLIPLKACLGDYVWFDANQNGQQDAGETGVASVTAVLYNATTNAVVSTTLTDATGKYLFCGLNPDSYYVRFTPPSGMTLTTPNTGNDATDSDAGTNGQTPVYSLTAGQQELTVDAGLIPVPCVPVSYTLCGAKTSLTLTAGSMYTQVQWFKDGVAILGATGMDYIATTAGLYSYSAIDASGCSVSLCCPVSVTTCLLACLGDYVWLDTNQNGQQDAGETGVASVTAVLYDAVSNTVVSTTVTDGTGRYRFCNLNPGQYYVRFTPPAGMTFTTPNTGPDGTDSDPGPTGQTPVYSLTAGQDEPTVDAGLVPLKACLGDYVWLDTNQNGQQDAGETGVASVTAVLYDAVSGTVVSTTVTDATGRYLFCNLNPGQYYVKFTAPAGTTFTTANVGADGTDSDVSSLTGQSGTTGVYTLTAGQTDLTVDAGLVPLKACLGDYVWLDTNQNGQQDAGETGVASVTAVLYDAVSNTVVSTTVTDGTGRYRFCNLNPGQYYVRFTPPAGTTFTTPNTGPDGTDSDPGPTGQTPVYSLTAGQDEPTVDAGLVPLKACLGDYVWFDTKQNGQQDAGETGVASVTAVLYDAVSGTVVSTTVTGSDGLYLFCNLNPGSYYVKFTVPADLTFTAPNTGPDATDSDVSSLTGQSGTTPVYSLTAGEVNRTVDAGLIPACVPASYTLCGTKTSFTLTTESTYANIQWFKDGVAIPGATTVDYIATAIGVYSYSAVDLSTGCSVSSCCPIKIVNCLLASLGDYVWLDTNKNGQQDPGETGVASVTVVLYDAVSGTIVSTTVTDSQGKYLFTNLNPGSYFVKFTAPAGTTFTTANVGSDATDSDVSSLTGQSGTTGVYTLTAGQNELTVDTGLIPVCVNGALAAGVRLSPNVIRTQSDIVQVTFVLTNPGSTSLSGISFTGTSSLFNRGTGERIPITLTPQGDVNNDGIMVPGEAWIYTGTFSSTYTPGTVFLITGSATALCGSTTVNAATADLIHTVGVNMDVVIKDNCFRPGSDLSVDLITRLLIDEDAAMNPGSVDVGGIRVQLPRNRFEARNLKIMIQGMNNNQYFNPFSLPAGISLTPFADQTADGGRNTNYVLDEQDPVNTARFPCTALGQDDVGCEFPDWVFHIQIPVPANYAASSFSVSAADQFTLFRSVETIPGSGQFGDFVEITSASSGSGPGGSDTDSVTACQAGVASLGDFVWLDTNQNGQQDATETGVANVTVVLYNASTGAKVSSTVTDATGKYLFTNLAPGSYYVQFLAPASLTYTLTTTGSAVTDSDVDAGGRTKVYTLTAGQSVLTVDAGFICKPAACIPLTIKKTRISR